MANTTPRQQNEAMIGCLLGTMVGDAFGLPCEGMPRQRQIKLFPNLDGYHFLLHRGMVSDDTEHSWMSAQALIVSGGDSVLFQRHLARSLQFWLLGLPAGIGYATLRAILKLWLGVKPDRSGVFSAGNGPAMRSAILGVCYPNDLAKLRALVQATTRITHTDPKAEWGAFAIALAAGMASLGSDVEPVAYLQTVRDALPSEAGELIGLLSKAVASADAGETTSDFANSFGLNQGITGYTYHTVPVVIQTWLRHQTDFRAGVQEIVRCGGDTDTTAAILGGLIGARIGKQGIPSKWLTQLWEWPRTVGWTEKLGERLAQTLEQDMPGQALSVNWIAIPVRNLIFLAAVLAHGFRRLLPPY